MTEHPAVGLALLDRLTVQLRDGVRSVTRDLRPAMLDEVGLAGALRELGARSASARRPVDVDVGELGEVPAAVEVAAYPVAAELAGDQRLPTLGEPPGFGWPPAQAVNCGCV